MVAKQQQRLTKAQDHRYSIDYHQKKSKKKKKIKIKKSKNQKNSYKNNKTIE